MVTRDGRLKVLDFGLARLSPPTGGALDLSAMPTLPGPISSAGQVIGTVPYMAPEQLRGEPVDERHRPVRARRRALRDGDRPAPLRRRDRGRRQLRDPAGRAGAARASRRRALGRARPGDRALPREGPAPAAPARRARSSSSCAPLQRAPASEAGPAAASRRHPLARRAAVRERDARRRPGVLRGRHDRGADLRPLAPRSLRVISRTSAMRYKGVHKALPEIARELERRRRARRLGAARRRPRAASACSSSRRARDETLWSDRYDRELEDVLDLQSEVAGKVAAEIALRLTPPEARRLARRRAVNPEAHLEYMKGQHVAEATSPQAIELSLRHFQSALELDPELRAGVGRRRALPQRAGEPRHGAPGRGRRGRARRRREGRWSSTSRSPRATPSSAGSTRARSTSSARCARSSARSSSTPG